MSIVAFIDESADPKRERVFALASLVGHELFWQQFGALMKERLQRDGIEVFHMTDCENGWGEFRKWKNDKARAIALVTDLVTLILDSKLVGAWSGEPLRDFPTIAR
jgi:hypothetical protein